MHYRRSANACKLSAETFAGNGTQIDHGNAFHVSRPEITGFIVGPLHKVQ